MKIITLFKLAGWWWLFMPGCTMRTPYAEGLPRADVVSYALRSFPGATVLEQ